MGSVLDRFGESLPHLTVSHWLSSLFAVTAVGVGAESFSIDFLFIFEIRLQTTDWMYGSVVTRRRRAGGRTGVRRRGVQLKERTSVTRMNSLLAWVATSVRVSRPSLGVQHYIGKYESVSQTHQRPRPCSAFLFRSERIGTMKRKADHDVMAAQAASVSSNPIGSSDLSWQVIYSCKPNGRWVTAKCKARLTLSRSSATGHAMHMAVVLEGGDSPNRLVVCAYASCPTEPIYSSCWWTGESGPGTYNSYCGCLCCKDMLAPDSTASSGAGSIYTSVAFVSSDCR